MLELGSFRSSSCCGMTRRTFVKAAASLPLAWGLTGAASAVTTSERRARSVILVWLWGGPSHLDTFDPKPEASREIRGPFATIPTRVPGVRFTELLPRLARRNDRFVVVRSSRFSGSHDMLPLTGGRRRGARQEPNYGSIIARHQEVVGAPPFVSVLPRTTLSHGFRADTVPGSRAGWLGGAYDPFLVRCDSDGGVDIPSLRLLDGITPQRLTDRRLLQRELDHLKRTLNTPAMDALDRQSDSAYSLLTAGEATRAFDVGQESDRTRASYGHTSFGQSLLLGRRLVEAGVPYVQVNWSLGVDGLEEGPLMGWDTHRNGFGQLMSYHCPVFDRAFSALLDDLDDRGLLDSTLIVAMGEMGRTPKINRNGGRDHWATCSTVWAGAGIGGGVIGATDRNGSEPVTDPVTPLMVGTTIAEAMGLDSQARAELRVLVGGSVIDGLL